MKANLIFDMSNLVYRNYFANKKEADLSVDLTFLGAFLSLMKYYKRYEVKDIVAAFDTPNSWRKIYTRNKSLCKTHQLYKGQRRQSLTEAEKARLEQVDEHLISMADLFKYRTGIITLKAKYLEADDLIAAFVQKFPDEHHIVISTDKDFIQLLRNKNVTLVNPDTEKPRDISEWHNDPDYYMFEKCFRGDSGDNVISSYPTLRAKRIKKAYDGDDFERVNIMNHAFIIEVVGADGNLVNYNYTTQEVYDENRLLMDLTMQPEYIRELMSKTVDEAIASRARLDYLSFLRFCGKLQLPRIIDNVANYMPLLRGRGSTE
jgi:hypothetical protein